MLSSFNLSEKTDANSVNTLKSVVLQEDADPRARLFYLWSGKDDAERARIWWEDAAEYHDLSVEELKEALATRGHEDKFTVLRPWNYIPKSLRSIPPVNLIERLQTTVFTPSNIAHPSASSLTSRSYETAVDERFKALTDAIHWGIANHMRANPEGLLSWLGCRVRRLPFLSVFFEELSARKDYESLRQYVVSFLNDPNNGDLEANTIRPNLLTAIQTRHIDLGEGLILPLPSSAIEPAPQGHLCLIM